MNTGLPPPTSETRLASRFRSSHILAAPPDANFGIKGTLANLCFLVWFSDLKFLSGLLQR